MYRTVTLALLGLVGCSLLAGLFGAIAYGPLAQLIALVPALALGLGLNVAVARLLGIHANHESAVITVLILFFLFIPQATLMGNWPLYLAVVLGLASKFLLVYRRQHIVNAAAFGAVAVAVVVWLANTVNGTNYTTDLFSWWVSNPTLFLPILILGGLVVMKVRKWTPVLWFLGAGLVVFLFEEWRFFDSDFSLVDSVELFLLSWPALFLAFFMLTEPFTMPPTKRTQAFYGAFVGVIMHTTLFADVFPMTPELALVLGNLAVYPFRIRRKLFLKLVSKREVATDTWEFLFEKPAGFTFQAGQYLEWMLPHDQPDSRGERRYFTIASAPTEEYVRLALKFVPEGSSYKRKLRELAVGDVIIASQLAGDFMLPNDRQEKLGFIAGGIGVTPFISHIKFMEAEVRQQPTVLMYCSNTVDELAYLPEFEAAALTIPLEVIPVIAKQEVDIPFEHGFVTEEMLARRVPDYRERHWYLSGPPPMVDAYDALLRKVGVPARKITKDFFPGLA
jgi:ferredoxin-NADP reductase